MWGECSEMGMGGLDGENEGIETSFFFLGAAIWTP